jgi:hypothetical protein
MAPHDIPAMLENLDRRTERIEQILPTLATKEELRIAIAEAVAPLATKEELRTAIAEAVAPLATKAEVRSAIAEEGERTRRHFDVVAEGLRDDIRLIAEGQVALQRGFEDQRQEFSALKADVASLDVRVTRLEADRPRRRSSR